MLLIMDSDPLVLQSLEMSLSRENEITIIGLANSGEEIFELCKVNKPDAVLMDIRWEGIDTIKEIKIRYPDVKLMVLTAFYNQCKMHQALSAGADEYFLKTDRISNIPEKLHTMIGGNFTKKYRKR